MLAPLVGLVAVGAVIVGDAQDTASKARVVESDAVPVRELMTLLDTVEQEYGTIELQLRAASLGMSLQQLAGLMHTTVALPATSQVATNAAVAGARALMPRGFERTLAALRAELDGGRADADELGGKYLALGATLALPLSDRLAWLKRQVAGLNGGRRVADAMETLDAVSGLLRYGTAQLHDLSRLLFSRPDARPPLIGALGRDARLYNDSAKRLLGLRLGLDTAARQAVVWGVTPCLESLSVAVNVSGRHLLGEGLHANVCSVLETTGLEPARLVLEVTETVLLTDIPVAAHELTAIRALGVRVAIDDFGTGYTSLGALQGLPIDSIKVDRSFVSRRDDARELSLVAMITQLGHQLGVTIVAAGVGTSEQRSALTDLGCDELQGYLICRPIPALDFQGRYAPVADPADSSGR